MNFEQVYGLQSDIKSFAIGNSFAETTNKACYALGGQLRPFCICANEFQKRAGVLDFTNFDSMLVAGQTVGDDIVENRANIYRQSGMMIDTKDAIKRKLLIFDYLMTMSICYVEVPKYTTKNGMATHTYDKFFVTRNPKLMATWVGGDSMECQAKYSSKIQANQLDFNNNEIKFVKLNTSGKGNSITVPRSSFKVEKMTCIPLYMLYAFIEGFKPVIHNNIVNFSYLKDNDTVRELNTTTNENIIRQYYTDNFFIHNMINNIDINSVKQGGMMLSSKMNRGYIKLPEIGGSIYDATGVRSLNVARILQAKIVKDVDRTYINVDINSVVQNFKDSVEYLIKKNPAVLRDVYKSLTETEPSSNEVALIADELYKFVDSRSAILSTTFHRQLHLFLITNPEWFPLYTGKPAQTVVSSANFGVAPMDF